MSAKIIYKTIVILLLMSLVLNQVPTLTQMLRCNFRLQFNYDIYYFPNNHYSNPSLTNQYCDTANFMDPLFLDRTVNFVQKAFDYTILSTSFEDGTILYIYTLVPAVFSLFYNGQQYFTEGNQHSGQRTYTLPGGGNMQGSFSYKFTFDPSIIQLDNGDYTFSIFKHVNGYCIGWTYEPLYYNNIGCSACAAGSYRFKTDVQYTCRINNCIDQSGSSCLACDSTTELDPNDHICIPKVPNCQTYDYVADDCQTCLSPYTQVNGACVMTTISNCKTMSGSICTQCQQGYVLDAISKTQCIPKINHCQQYDFLLNNCNKCKEPYQQTGGLCVIPLVPNCKNFNSRMCTQCQQNYVLVTSNGLKYCVQKVDQCKKYSSVKCIECNKNYQITNAGLCSLAINSRP